MAEVLTEKSKIECAHKGSIQLTGAATTSTLTVAGAKVLVQGDLNGKPISGCTTTPDPNTSTLQCLSVTGALAFPGTTALKLKVGGKPVLLKPLMGFTNGTVGGTPQTWSVQDPGQTKLKTL